MNLIKLFLLSLIFIYGCSSSQSDVFVEKASNEEMNHKYILEYNDDTLKTQSYLFEKSILWVVKNWKNTYSVIDYKDKDAGQLIIKGYIPNGIYYHGTYTNGGDYYESYSISYKMVILTKPNKISVEFIQVYPAHTFQNGQWVSMEIYYKSKLLHKEAKKNFDEYVKDFDRSIKGDNF